MIGWLAALITATTPAPVERFALVIGNNAPLADSAYEPLRYADDDAARFAELMTVLGAEVELLTVADRETRERFGATVEGARPPRREEVLRAIARLERRLQAAEGGTREVYVYFSGHGSVTSSNAYLHLLDGPFSRTDIYQEILDRLPRERLHLVIDSCHAYFLASARGRVQAEVETERIDRHPDVGFILSTSDRREVHEWDGYRAGVFSYQVLGALSGAADVDEDGCVSYAELHAYVVAANLGISNPRARIHPFVRRPTAWAPQVLDLRGVPASAQVRVPRDVAGRLRVRDARGYAYLDANKPAGLGMRLIAPRPAPSSLDVEGRRYALRPGSPARYAATASTAAIGHVATRGAVEDEFRKNLFARPLSPDFVAGLEAAFDYTPAPDAVAMTAPRPWTEDPVTLTLLGSGAGALAVGGIFAGLFAQSLGTANQRPVTQETIDARGRAEAYRTVMAVGIGAGVALVTAGLVSALFEPAEAAP